MFDASWNDEHLPGEELHRIAIPHLDAEPAVPAVEESEEWLGGSK